MAGNWVAWTVAAMAAYLAVMWVALTAARLVARKAEKKAAPSADTTVDK